VSRGILANVEAHQEQPEHRQPAQAIEQRAIGDHVHAAGMQRAVAKLQRPAQLFALLQHFGRRRLAVLDGRARPVAGGAQAVAQGLEQDPIGFGRRAGLLQQLVAGGAHRQGGDQPFDLPEIELGRHLARRQQHLAGHHGGDVRVAIAITAHPGGEADRRGLQRQVQAGRARERRIRLAQHVGHGSPQRVLDGGKAPLGLFHRGRAVAADFLGVPDLGDQPLQLQLDAGTLGRRQVGMVARRQLLGDGVVLLDQGAPGNLGGVGGQDQLDFQPADLARQEFFVVPGGLEALEQVGKHAGLERRGLPGTAAANLVVLLGDVGQVEELVERTGHRQQFVLIEAVQRLGQQLRALLGPAPRRLGTLADAFDLVEEQIAVLRTDGVAEQFSQQVYVVAQARIDDFRHDPVPSASAAEQASRAVAQRAPAAPRTSRPSAPLGKES